MRPNAARAATDRSRGWIAERLASVHVRAPAAVTLSSSSGDFASTIRNDLDHPVTVSLLAETDAPLRIEGAARIDVPANGRATVLLNARTNETGIHRVTLVLTDTGGNPLGGTTRISIRSAQVSNVIWLFVGLGLVLLFAAIAIRLFRRVRASLHGGPPSPSNDGAAGGAAGDDSVTAEHDAGSKTPAGATAR